MPRQASGRNQIIFMICDSTHTHISKTSAHIRDALELLHSPSRPGKKRQLERALYFALARNDAANTLEEARITLADEGHLHGWSALPARGGLTHR
jgi:hypothetical protein